MFECKKANVLEKFKTYISEAYNVEGIQLDNIESISFSRDIQIKTEELSMLHEAIKEMFKNKIISYPEKVQICDISILCHVSLVQIILMGLRIVIAIYI